MIWLSWSSRVGRNWWLGIQVLQQFVHTKSINKTKAVFLFNHWKRRTSNFKGQQSQHNWCTFYTHEFWELLFSTKYTRFCDIPFAIFSTVWHHLPHLYSRQLSIEASSLVRPSRSWRSIALSCVDSRQLVLHSKHIWGNECYIVDGSWFWHF